jgi:hypothetical protein
MKHQPLLAISLELADPVSDILRLDPGASIHPPAFAQFDQFSISYESLFVGLSKCNDRPLVDGTGRYQLASAIDQPSLKISRLQSESTIFLDEHTSTDEAID